MVDLERVEALERRRDGVLHEVRSLLRASQRGRQTAVCPSAKRGHAPFEQALEGKGIPTAGLIEQFNRRLWRQRFGSHLRKGVDGEDHTPQDQRN